jgi:hypothetical protein
VPPTNRPLPRFIAEPPHDVEPYGRWADRLLEPFAAACARIEGDVAAPAADSIVWHPERTYAGRVYVPATAPAGEGLELFGYVSFLRTEAGEPADFAAAADYTDETAESNPDWKIDLNDEVIGRWHGPGDATGDVTLVWGTPRTAGGAAVTAELGGETVDQCLLGQDERFTLVALDAVTGIGIDDLYLEVTLWSRRGRPLAMESLYQQDPEGQ